MKVTLPAELGEIIGGYRLERVLGSGGMGCVYYATHVKLGRRAAVKVLDERFARDARYVGRFFREAKIVTDIGHPNIIDVLDFVETASPLRVAYVMELVEGSTLAALLTARRLSVRQASNIALQLAGALRAVHAVHVVHRDLKPANVALLDVPENDYSKRPSVKILDFGIAKVHQSARELETDPGSMIGTPAYMAPEQISGEPVSPATDVYALGEIFYEMISGRRVFAADRPSVLRTKLIDLPPNLELPEDVASPETIASLVHRCLAHRPGDRPSLLDLEGLLTQLVDLEPPHAPAVLPPMAGSSSGRSVRSEPGAIPLAGVSSSRVVALPPSKRRWVLAVIAAFAVLAIGVMIQRALPPPVEVTVLLRMMEKQEDWLRTEGLDTYAREHGAVVRVHRYRSIEDVVEELERRHDIDLVKVELPLLRPLVEKNLVLPIDRYLIDAGRKGELEEISAEYDPLALDTARVPDLVGRSLYGLPRKVETSIAAYRKSKVVVAKDALPALRASIESDLVRLTGHGLPAVYDLEVDPSEWDSYDLFVASYAWAHVPDHGKTSPRVIMRSQRYAGTVSRLYGALAALSSEEVPAFAATTAMIDLLEWEALFRELDLYHPKMFLGPSEVITGYATFETMRDGEAYYTITHSLGLGMLHGSVADHRQGMLPDPDDLGVALCPKGVSLELDGTGSPVRVGTRRASITGYIWAVPRRAPHPEHGYRLARHLTGPAVNEREVRAFLIQPVQRGVTFGDDPFARQVGEVVGAQMRESRDLRFPQHTSVEGHVRFRDSVADLWWKVIGERRYLEDGRISRERIRAEILALPPNVDPAGH